MKKILFLLTLIASISLASCSFSNRATKEEEPQKETQVEEQAPKKETSKKIVVSSAPTDISGFEVMGRYEGNISGNENDDTVTLYASVKRDSDGVLLWDDSQTWVLQVETDDGVYELYRQTIQGNAYINVSEFYKKEGTKNVVTLFETSSATNKVIEYTYGDKAFEEIVRYSTDEIATEGINPLFSSIPNYR